MVGVSSKCRFLASFPGLRLVPLHWKQEFLVVFGNSPGLTGKEGNGSLSFAFRFTVDVDVAIFLLRESTLSMVFIV